jgi:hypothetical protein
MKCDAPSDDARPEVLAVVQAVHKSTAGMDAFGVVQDPERNGAAALLAVYRGRLTVGSKPPYPTAITASGLAEREGHGVRDRRLSGNRQRP